MQRTRLQNNNHQTHRAEIAKKYARILSRSHGYDLGSSFFIGDIAALQAGVDGSGLEQRAREALLQITKEEEKIRESHGWTQNQLKQCQVAIAYAGGLLGAGHGRTPVSMELRKKVHPFQMEEAIQIGRLIRLAVAVAEYMEVWKKRRERGRKRSIGACEHLVMTASLTLPNVKLIRRDVNYPLLPRTVKREIERTAELQAA